MRAKLEEQVVKNLYDALRCAETYELGGSLLLLWLAVRFAAAAATILCWVASADPPARSEDP